jgi:hypothetical protein
MSRYCPDLGADITNIGSDIWKNDTIQCLDDTISETAISGHILISVRVLSRYRGRNCDIISRSVLNFFVPSGVPSRDQHNDPDDDDDDDDLNGNREMGADEMRDYEDQDPHIPPTSTVLLPSLDPMPAFFKTCLIIMIWPKRTSTRLSRSFRCQRPDLRHHWQPPGILIHAAKCQQLRQVIYTDIQISYPM